MSLEHTRVIMIINAGDVSRTICKVLSSVVRHSTELWLNYNPHQTVNSCTQYRPAAYLTCRLLTLRVLQCWTLADLCWSETTTVATHWLQCWRHCWRRWTTAVCSSSCESNDCRQHQHTHRSVQTDWLTDRSSSQHRVAVTRSACRRYALRRSGCCLPCNWRMGDRRQNTINLALASRFKSDQINHTNSFVDHSLLSVGPTLT